LSIAELDQAGISLSRDEYLHKGFMPRLYEGDVPPGVLYAQYYQTYVERDVRQIANIRNLIAFETFIRLLAGRVGQIVNMNDLSNSIGVSASTLTEWLGILEASFIIFRLPPYFENFGKRLIKSPKVYFTEPGLAAWLLGMKEPGHIASGPFLGGLFENMVVVETLKSRFNKGEEANLYFWRDNNGTEADLLVSGPNGLTPVEIKAAMTFSPDFAKALPKLRKASAKIRHGYVIYAGDLEATYKDDRFINFTHTSQVID
jgi:predicted AAA+ superfamily ATPase